jgi:hypothetical protein
MEESVSQDALLSSFLRGLADTLDKGELAPTQVQMIGEFFMAYQFRTQALKDNDMSLEVGDGDFDHEDVVKFFVLGWFVYCVLMKEGTLASPDCEDPEE